MRSQNRNQDRTSRKAARSGLTQSLHRCSRRISSGNPATPDQASESAQHSRTEKGGDMGQDILLRRLDQAAGLKKQLVSEKNEATARIQYLEREMHELMDLLSPAVSKVDEALRAGPASLASEGFEDLKQRFPLAFTLD